MTDIAELQLVGGRLCLDFVNTANWDGTEVVEEHLHTPGDLAAWAKRVGLGLTPAVAGRGRDGGIPPEVTQFRAQLRDMLLRMATDRPLSSRDARLLNEALGTPRSRPLVRASRGALEYAQSGNLAGALHAPVAISAVELLTSSEHRLVKQCPGPHCGWLFLDESRNRTRRWCSMQICGNRTKARLHYARKTSR